MKIVWMLSLLCAPALAAAQAPATPTDGPVAITRGTFFALSVADLEASSRWYTEKLGLKPIMEVAKTSSSPGVVVLEGGGLLVELIQNDAAVPLSQAAPTIAADHLVHGIFKVGIVVDDLGATLAALKARGVEPAMGPFPAQSNQPANAIIRDNSGTYIQLFGR